MDDLPKEAWIILYVTNEPSDWIGCFPSDHYQHYYTQRRNGLPHHFDSYKEAREFAEREYLDYYIIVPIAGEPAIKFATEQKRLCNIPDVVGQSGQLHSCKYVKRVGESCTLNNNCKYPNCE